MKKKQLALLLICNVAVWILGNGLFALLPVYAVRLGADTASIGNYLSLAFVALTVGTIGAGWLSNKFGRQKLFIIGAGFVAFVCTWLMGAVNQFWQVLPLTAVVWLCGGTIVSMTAVVAGLLVSEAERGKVFGLFGLNGAIGAVVGGALSGNIVDRWGYSVLFLLAAFGWLVPSIFGLFLPKTVRLPTVVVESKNADSPKVALGPTFYLVLLAGIIVSIPGFIVSLGRPLIMDQLGYDPAAISGVVAVGSAVSLPFPFVLAWLSGRVGHYRMIAFCYGLAVCGVVLLLVSGALWQFWLSAIFMAIASAGGTVGMVLVGKIVPPEALSNGIAQYGANGWIGAVIGLSGTGYALKLVGANVTFGLGAVLGLLAIGLLFLVRVIGSKRASGPLNPLEQAIVSGPLMASEAPAPADQ